MDGDIVEKAPPSIVVGPPTSATAHVTLKRQEAAKEEEEEDEEKASLAEEEEAVAGDENPPSVVDAALALQQQLRARLLAHAARRIQRLWRQYKEEVESTVCPDDDEDYADLDGAMNDENADEDDRKSRANSCTTDEPPPLPVFHGRSLETGEARQVPFSQQQQPSFFAGVDAVISSSALSQPGSFSYPQKQPSSNAPLNTTNAALAMSVAPPIHVGRSQQLRSAAVRIEEAWRRYRKAVALEEQLQKEARWDAARATTAAVVSSAVSARARAVPTSPTGSTVSATSGSFFAIPSIMSVGHQNQQQQPSPSALSTGAVVTAVPSAATAAQHRSVSAPLPLPAPALNLSQDDLEAMLQEREDELEERSAHAALLELEREMGRSLSSSATGASHLSRKQHFGGQRGIPRASCSSSNTSEGSYSSADRDNKEGDSDDDAIGSIISHALLRSASSRRGSSASLLRPTTKDSDGAVMAGDASSGHLHSPPTAAAAVCTSSSSSLTANNALLRATAAVLIQRALRERNWGNKGSHKPPAQIESGRPSGVRNVNDNDTIVDVPPSSAYSPPSVHFDPAVKTTPFLRQRSEEDEVSSPSLSFDVPDLPESVENALRILQNRFRFGILRRNLRARDRDEAARRVQEAWRRRRAIASHFEAIANGRREAAAREIQMAFRAMRLNRRRGDGTEVVGSPTTVDSPIDGNRDRVSPPAASPPPSSISAPSSSSLPLCVICMTDVVQVALLPCGHAHLCGECASCLNRCPACRKRVALQIRIFL